MSVRGTRFNVSSTGWVAVWIRRFSSCIARNGYVVMLTIETAPQSTLDLARQAVTRRLAACFWISLVVLLVYIFVGVGIEIAVIKFAG
jgi:hypothetical protein